jgi:tRNA threonylcarbamoyl adenosine modification protein (Sua5/YciO/YrdC/YwlC family)
VLARGHVAVLPTETLYGLSASAESAAAVSRIMQLKCIDEQRGFVALVESAAALRMYLAAGVEPRILGFLRNAWPAPLTAVVRVREPVAWGKQLDSGWSAAFRVPAHARLRALLARLRRPLLSTSVNRTGQPPLTTLEEIARVFGQEPDVWMFRDRGLEARHAAAGSTVADFTTWPPRVLRSGGFELEAALRDWAAGGA